MTPSSSAVAQLPKNRQSSTLAVAWRRFKTRKLAVVALAIVILQLFMAIFAKYVAPYDELYSDFAHTYQAKSTAQHWLGTDDLGRDILSRLIFGARVSYAVGILSQFALVLVGIPIGSLSGLAGGWIDFLIMRIIDILSSVPGILLYILLMIALGPGLDKMILAMSITGWIGIARLVRGQVLSIRQTDYVRASRAMGANSLWVFRTHIVRNVLSPIIVTMTLGVPGAMQAEAGLSWLGLGVPPPTSSWGQMIGAYGGFILSYPHLLIYPMAVLTITMTLWIFLGDGVRDAMDPSIRV